MYVIFLSTMVIICGSIILLRHIIQYFPATVAPKGKNSSGAAAPVHTPMIGKYFYLV